MISLAAYIMCGVVMILVLPKYTSRPYQMPRKTLLGIGSFVLLGIWMAFSRRCYVDEPVMLLILSLFAWWFFRSATSANPWISLQQFTIFLSAAVMGLFLLTPEYELTGMMILVVAAAVNSVVAILQAVFHVQLMPRVERFKPNHAKGLIAASPNFTGGYLAPHVFIALQLAVEHSWYWLPMLALLLYGLWLTKCRAAMLGLIAGAIFAGSISWVITVIVLAALGGFALFDPDMRRRVTERSDPIKDRINFWKIAWLQIKRAPLGIGFDIMKTRVPFLQRELNAKTNGAFLDPKNYADPKPERMHSDPIQHMLDVGIPGIIGMAVLLYFALTSGPHSLQGAALVAMLVNGLFIHLWYHPPTLILFWYLVGSLLHQASGGFGYWVFDLKAFHVGAFTMLGFLVYEHIIKEQIFDTMKSMWGKAQYQGEEFLDRLLRIRPNDSHVRVWAAHYYHARQQFDQAVKHLTHATENFDGGTLTWFLYNDLAGAFYWAGSPGLGEKAAEEALSFLPTFQAARVNQIVCNQQMEKWRKAADDQEAKNTPVGKG